ncbi:MAG: site-specific integrase [Planctomycetes bacterium]|nr:site-specific integrase [Planctomycetota bacterium]
MQDGFSTHAFRHSFQIHLLEESVAVHHVKTLMGHSRNRDSMYRYAHAPRVQLRHSMANAFDDTDGLFEPPSGTAGAAVNG